MKLILKGLGIGCVMLLVNQCVDVPSYYIVIASFGLGLLL
jgi:hypothetical protein